MVFVDRRPRGLDADVVVSTNESGAAEAVRHLLSHGHRRIAYLGDAPTIPTARDRLAGYRDAMATAGLEVDERLVLEGVGDTTLADGAISRLLDDVDPPTALFTAQNFVTVGAIRALRRVDRQQEVAVVGFDDFPLADLLDPAVTVVAQDVAALGRIAAERLFARIAGDGSAPKLHLVPTTLIRRGSGEIHRLSRSGGRGQPRLVQVDEGHVVLVQRLVPSHDVLELGRDPYFSPSRGPDLRSTPRTASTCRSAARCLHKLLCFSPLSWLTDPQTSGLTVGERLAARCCWAWERFRRGS